MRSLTKILITGALALNTATCVNPIARYDGLFRGNPATAEEFKPSNMITINTPGQINQHTLLGIDDGKDGRFDKIFLDGYIVKDTSEVSLRARYGRNPLWRFANADSLLAAYKEVKHKATGSKRD